MGYMDVYTFYVDYEPPEEPGQPRCKKCGRFLPYKPTGEAVQGERNGHWDYITDQWVQDGPDFILPPEPVWKCKCGEEWGSGDIF